MAKEILQKLEKPPVKSGALGFFLNCTEEERFGILPPTGTTSSSLSLTNTSSRGSTLGRKLLVH